MKAFRAYLLALAGLCVFSAGGYCQDKVSTFSPLTLETTDRVLILAPHPDDEILACGGIIQQAVKLGLPLRIVFFTYGDSNQWSFLVYRKHLVFFPQAVQNMGLIRHDEDVSAAAALGVSGQQLVFLGYPDFGTLDIWRKHWGNAPSYTSILARATAVPYKSAMHPGALYKGEAVLADLKTILNEFKPTKIFLSHPADHNMDHRALYLFTVVAVWDLGLDKQVVLYPYLIHYKGWPLPRGRHPDQKLLPPVFFDGKIDWQVNALTPEQVDRKNAALKKHKTQFESSASYLEAFVRANELFGDFPTVIPQEAGRFEDEARLESEGQLDELSDEERLAFVGIKKYSLRLENDRVVFSINLTGKLGKAAGLSLYLFGYRNDIPFAQMPKIHAQFGALFHHVYDQTSKVVLGQAGIEVFHKDQEMSVSVPLRFLGDPSRILISANTYLGNVPLDLISWRIFQLPEKNPLDKPAAPVTISDK